MSYNRKVMKHFENPQNVGSFASEEQNIGTALVGAPECGDVMRLQIKVNDGGVIEDVRFQTFGCLSAIASSSLITEKIKGLTLDEALNVTDKEIAEELNLPKIKKHCSVLAEHSIRKAIQDYKRNKDGGRIGDFSDEMAFDRPRSRGNEEVQLIGDCPPIQNKELCGQLDADVVNKANLQDLSSYGITVTPSALKRIKSLLSLKEAIGIKISVKYGGCSGLSYFLEYVDNGDGLEDKICIDDATIFIDKKSIMYLIGTEIDYEDGMMRSGFLFKNPNALKKCGCGSSFGV